MENFVFRTKSFTYTIEKDGRVSSLTDNKTGRNIVNTSVKSFFASLYYEPAFIERDIHADPARNYLYVAGPLVPTGAKPVLPKEITVDGTVLSVYFPGNVKADFSVEVFDEYLVFELQSELPQSVYSITFADTPLDFDAEDEDAFCAVGYAMRVNTKPHFYPAPVEKGIRAEAFSKIGAKGAKMAVVGSEQKNLIGIMRNINKTISPDEMTISECGGPFADTKEGVLGTYTIIYDVENQAEIDSLAEKYKRYCIKQVDFHQGKAYIQGDFLFDKKKYNNSASEFRRLVVEPFTKHGFTVGLHTYAFFLSTKCERYLSDPKAQAQLVYHEEFTLDGDMNENDTFLRAAEDVSQVSTITGFREKNSLFLLVDEEILSYSETGSGGFVIGGRGLCGTKAAFHKKGAKVRHLSMMFGYFVPKIGGELFYEIARNTAKTYNEGGFGMIYMDALDGLSMFEPEFGWYYAAKFILEILRGCKTPPLMEYSVMFPLLWYCRSRCGAWDIPYRGYKKFLNDHVRFNISTPHMYNLPKMLGWFNLYPPVCAEKYPAKQVPVLFEDDVDHLGTRALGYDQSMAYQFLHEDYLEKFPALRRNTERFALYEKLRVEHYFPKSVTDRLKNAKKEFSLVEKENGEYAIEERYYTKNKLYPDIPGGSTVKAVNPFFPQKPLIRIQALHSGAVNCDKIILKERDTDTVRFERVFRPYLNIAEKQALKVQVYGNGSDDAFLIQLKAAHHCADALACYFVRCDFIGWREFVLAEYDNGEFEDGYFDGKGSFICSEHMFNFNYAFVETLKIYTHGECKGVRVGEISAVECASSPIVNPVLSLNQEEIKFNGRIDSGEYLEYKDGKAFVFDIFGNSRQVEVVDGLSEIPGGSFTASLSCEKENGYPVRAGITFGFAGEEII